MKLIITLYLSSRKYLKLSKKDYIAFRDFKMLAKVYLKLANKGSKLKLWTKVPS